LDWVFAISVPQNLLLFAGDGLPLALAGAGVRVRALTTDRETLTVADATVTADVHQALDVETDVLAKVAFHRFFGGDYLANTANFVFREVANLGTVFNLCPVENAMGLGAANPIDVGQSDFNALLDRQIDSSDTCHAVSLALTLLVLGVLFADNSDDAFTPDYLAVLAQLLNRGPYFHGLPLGCLLESVDDATTGQIVGGNLDQYPVTRQNANEVLSHLPTDVGQHLVLVLKLDTEDRVGQGLYHCGFELNGFFFAQAFS